MSQAAAQIFSTEFMESTIQIRGWGNWARKNGMGTKYPAWVILMQTGYRESPGSWVPEIDDDYGMRLDRMIAELPEFNKNVLVLLYLGRVPFHRLPSIMRTTKHQVQQARDFALSVLYGRLSTK